MGEAQYMPVASADKTVVFAAIYGFVAWIPGLGVHQFGAHQRRRAHYLVYGWKRILAVRGLYFNSLRPWNP